MPTKPSFAAVAILIVFSLIAGTLVFMLIATRVENVIITLISVIISIIIIAIIIIKDYSDKIKDYNYASQNFKEYQKEQYKKRAAYVRSQAVNFITSKNKVQCPFCQSTNVVPISGVERVFSLIMLGRFSKKINKSFKCDNCDGTFQGIVVITSILAKVSTFSKIMDSAVWGFGGNKDKTYHCNNCGYKW